MAENRNAQQVREITDKLEQGLKELFESERFKEYLKTMSKFYNYSFNNTLLIAMQKPDATLIAGYTAWQRNFDRHVMKGEKVYGDNVFEKHGINRDRTGDGEKPRCLCGKRGIFNRDGAANYQTT